ncbi:ClbS/DfsB family four-helix bundle protein [Candidatus Saccharibacteria bacterium]|nr:ClbS/DfsB family four-helix bundle protein [Candidatus Saccharibacteria bacterium]MCL1963091.1 ClbS/DfsB family four-helix bundle protein [Candidatus Saccharibacteria bacterium]
MCGIQDKNARDLLMHLHEWHKMLIEWYDKNTAGEKVSFLPEGFSWKTTPELNKLFWENYQNVTLPEAKELLRKSHAEVMERMGRHNNDELFIKSRYDWTGTTSLGAYFVSATSSHYDWATKLLKKM